MKRIAYASAVLFGLLALGSYAAAPLYTGGHAVALQRLYEGSFGVCCAVLTLLFLTEALEAAR